MFNKGMHYSEIFRKWTIAIPTLKLLNQNNKLIRNCSDTHTGWMQTVTAYYHRQHYAE